MGKKPMFDTMLVSAISKQNDPERFLEILKDEFKKAGLGSIGKELEVWQAGQAVRIGFRPGKKGTKKNIDLAWIANMHEHGEGVEVTEAMKQKMWDGGGPEVGETIEVPAQKMMWKAEKRYIDERLEAQGKLGNKHIKKMASEIASEFKGYL